MLLKLIISGFFFKFMKREKKKESLFQIKKGEIIAF